MHTQRCNLPVMQPAKAPLVPDQADVLRACGITQLLDAALAGFHVTVMTYGQTGSGKTFTMSGREDALEADDYAGESAVLIQAPCHAPPSSMHAEERPPLHIGHTEAAAMLPPGWSPISQSCGRSQCPLQARDNAVCWVLEGDSDDGIVTRSVMYLYNCVQKSGRACTLRCADSTQ